MFSYLFLKKRRIFHLLTHHQISMIVGSGPGPSQEPVAPSGSLLWLAEAQAPEPSSAISQEAH